ncbi:SLC13 family permease [Catenovulum sediminis]|uniref:SLC13 family permease n=1 Tax=Catenovulum sediminis TaxID=1740262 RepID=A0ABV1RMF4_9ALTE|nr:SLC13 family permease [Catenovulum sediminis]
MYMEQAAVAAIFIGTIGALVFSHWRAANIFSAALLCLFALQISTVQTSLEKAVNPGVVTLLALMLASRALERTSLLKLFARHALEKNETRTLIKLTGLSALASSFLNNTAVVAALLRPIKNQNKVPASKLLIPLSYAAILGGTTTLIGTSTNMVVNSFWMDTGNPSLSFFAFFPVGIALLGCGLVVMLLNRYMLPTIHVREEQKQYFVDIKVMPESPLVGKSISDNHLRNLNSFFLVEIIRRGQSIAPVRPTHIIEAEDRLVFSGEINHIEELQTLPGVKLFAEHSGLMSDNLVEVVLASNSGLIGKTLKSAGFRAMFDAAVVGLKRNGLSVPGKLGEIILKEGDNLLLAAGRDFRSRKNLDKHFILVTDVVVEQPLSLKANWGVIGGFSLVMVATICQWVSLLQGLVFFIAACLATKVVKSAELKRLFPFDLWIIITAALTMADAMISSGLSATLAESLHSTFSEQSVWFAFLGILLVTVVLTELVTNNAAAALMFPLAISLAESFSVNPLSFVMAVAFGASASFLSPYGYQTNLLVFNTGGYKFIDFVRYGLPLTIVYISITALLVPYFFPF